MWLHTVDVYIYDIRIYIILFGCMSAQSITLSLILTPTYCMCPCCRVAGTLKYAHTQSSLSMLEKITRCVQMNEPALLVGETGVGKTAAISYLAKATGIGSLQ